MPQAGHYPIKDEFGVACFRVPLDHNLADHGLREPLPQDGLHGFACAHNADTADPPVWLTALAKLLVGGDHPHSSVYSQTRLRLGHSDTLAKWLPRSPALVPRLPTATANNFPAPKRTWDVVERLCQHQPCDLVSAVAKRQPTRFLPTGRRVSVCQEVPRPEVRCEMAYLLCCASVSRCAAGRGFVAAVSPARQPRACVPLQPQTLPWTPATNPSGNL
jgi:hypothetical protein